MSKPRTFVLSNSRPDRAGDIVRAEGWKLGDFQRNPIALFGHDSRSPIGQWRSVRVEGDRLLGDLDLYSQGVSPHADQVRRIFDDGGSLAVSVGFKPIKSKPLDSERPWHGLEFIEHELVEASIVAVPANPDALALGKAAHGVIRKSFLMEGSMSTAAIVTREQPAPPADLRVVPAPAIVGGKQRPYSLASVMRALAGDRVDIGLEMEISQEIERRAGSPRPGFNVPLLSLFAKANNATVFPATTPTVPTAGNWANAAIEQLLAVELVAAAIAKELVTGRAGVRVITTLERQIRIPLVSSKPTMTVVAIDADLPDPVDPNVAATEINPVTVGGRALLKRSIMYAHGGEETIRALIAQALVEKIDAVALDGNTAPAVNGLLDIATASSVTAIATATAAQNIATILHEGDSAMQVAGGAAVLASDLSLAWLGYTPAWTGSALVVPSLASRVVVPSLNLPVNTATTPDTAPFLAGNFAAFVVGMFGPGASVEINPFGDSLWKSGSFEMRIMVDMGTGCVDPLQIIKSAAPITN